MKSNKTNARRVAKASGVAYTTIATFVQGGTQSFKGDTEERIARAFSATPDELFGGAGQSAVRIPVISSVAAGHLSDPDASIPDEATPLQISGLPPGDYFATRVQGDSMNRISPHGSLIIVNRAERNLVSGRRYIFTRGGATTYKRWATDPPRLEPETTAPEANPTIYPHGDEEWSVVGRVRMTLLDDL